ncbi:hypothetical protein SEUCBS139899_002547 [Sporothrix eucalyptigena]
MTSSESNYPSQLVVTITDTVLNFVNGSDASIFPSSSSTAITACLTPAHSTLMWMPFDPYFDKMMNLTNNSIYDMGRSSGVSGRIPNQQLVQPHTSIDQTTGATLVNNTAPDLLIDSLQNT